MQATAPFSTTSPGRPSRPRPTACSPGTDRAPTRPSTTSPAPLVDLDSIGPSGVWMGQAFDNLGTVDLQDGVLLLGGNSPGGEPVRNSGVVTLASGTILAALTDYDQTAGSTTLFYGTFSGGNLNIEGGTLAGPGTINANVTNAGQVIPGGTGARIAHDQRQLHPDRHGRPRHRHRRHDGRQPVRPARRLGHRDARRHGQCLPHQRLPARSGQHVPAPDLRVVLRELRLLQRDRPRQPPAPRSRAESHQPDAHRPAGRHDDDPRRPAFALGLRPERDLHGRRSPSPCRRPRSIRSRPARSPSTTTARRSARGRSASSTARTRRA